jgi:hypothetical protein
MLGTVHCALQRRSMSGPPHVGGRCQCPFPVEESEPRAVKWIKISRSSRALLTHAYNPGYSGGRNQEDHGSKLAPGKSFTRPCLENPITKKSWWSGSSLRVPASNTNAAPLPKKIVLLQSKNHPLPIYTRINPATQSPS